MPEEHNREDESRKRKRGEVEHNPDLSETTTGMSLTLFSCQGLVSTKELGKRGSQWFNRLCVRSIK